ncbi:MAG: hypothetical protein UT78_C0005G0006 [Candidatus Nomurabacteria bacterium GW2011_GWF2_40_12]|uniref:Uncharacterized protein n=2 Tax=Candidatus Nomuraibacteriota TaxID=1752729 RepID=A0A0G0TZB1_9BACT|nr:MAG: hypothetical protein UT78_C0005G0006 [Candidatus Nomurabacteria bacterium GW2011_GWF2_40_12]OGJ15480.1 MAG: hypothetical protein A2585_01295 [Candidatus Nomurabacteria bacterium RIFOXYD1_FULL_39_12]
MKKYISLFVVLSMMLVVSTGVARAENDNNGARLGELKLKAEVKGDRDEVRAEMRLQIETTREEAKQKMETLRERVKEETDKVKARVKEMRIVGREKALERFDNAVERISEWQIKVEAKIAELEAKGVAVATAKDFLATSETKLTAAENKIVEINAVLAVSIDELTAENKTKLRTLAEETQTLVVEAHKALRDAIKSLKDEVRIKIEANAKVEAETEDDEE